jgi:predicted RNA-binding protein with PUA-like domain
MNYWLVKSEPSKYSWEAFEQQGRTCWDGVRNFQARNNLSAMKSGDWVLFYHSNEGKQVVGIAEVAREGYPDPSAQGSSWVAVDLIPVQKLAKPVTLEQMKTTPELQQIALFRQSQLSVMPLRREEFDLILALGND